MCGIVGLIRKDGAKLTNPNIIVRMASNLQHRGPDDEGFHIEGPAALGFRRVEIIDIEGSKQPMSNEDKSIWSLFNGTIYNYRELREILKRKGHLFKTKGDSETIVHAYEEFGLDFVEHLRGMFAIAIWDSNKKKLILARDRFGQKPLFYSISENEFAFASEMKAFLPWPGFKKDINIRAIHDYLNFLFIPEPQSIFSNVKKVQPASLIVYNFRTQSIDEKTYWNLRFNDTIEQPMQTIKSQLTNELEESIKMRLTSDAPLGLFLSGGIDSSVIGALHNKITSNSLLKTFTVGYNYSTDERKRAKAIANYLGSEHTEISIPEITADDLYKIAWHLDEPFGDTGAIAVYFGCKYASKYIKVGITGDGGDELFAGYEYFKKLKIVSTLSKLPKPIINGFELFIMKFGKTLVGDLKTKRLLKLLNATKLGRECRFLYFKQNLDRLEIPNIMHHDHLDNIQSYQFEQTWKKDIIKFHENIDETNLYLYLTTKLTLSNQYLTKWDRMAMASGIETRSPMLDHKLAEYCFSIPGKLKLKGFTTKFVLKSLAQELYPKSLGIDRKRGFDSPMDFLFDSQIRELIADCLSEQSVKKRNILDSKEVNRLREGYLTNKLSSISQFQRKQRLWSLLILELWFRNFIDNP